MRTEYNFSKGKRGAARRQRGKTRLSIHVDNAVLNGFRALAEKKGAGYQAMMNEALLQYLGGSTPEVVTKQELREVLREEMALAVRELSKRPRTRRES